MSVRPDNPDADEMDELIDGMMEDVFIKFEVYLMAHDVMDSYDS